MFQCMYVCMFVFIKVLGNMHYFSRKQDYNKKAVTPCNDPPTNSLSNKPDQPTAWAKLKTKAQLYVAKDTLRYHMQTKYLQIKFIIQK